MFHSLLPNNELLAHKNKAVPPLKSKLFPIIKRCMQKDPKKRYKDFEELRNNITKLYKKETGKKPSPPIIKIDEAINYNNRGVSLSELGLFDEAIKEYKKAIKTNKNYWQTYINLGSTFYENRQYNECIKVSRKGLKIAPNNDALLYNLGKALERIGQRDEAMVEFRKIIDMSKDDYYLSIAHLLIGNILYIKGQISDAIQNIKKASELNPKLLEAYKALATIYHKNKRYDEAINEWKKALKITPDNPVLHFNLGNCYLSVLKYENALDEFDIAFQINKNRRPRDKELDRRLEMSKSHCIQQLEKRKKLKEEFKRMAEIQEKKSKQRIAEGRCALCGTHMKIKDELCPTCKKLVNNVKKAGKIKEKENK